jgi:hypothetical protein
MVFTMAFEGDAAQHDQLVIAFGFFERPLQKRRRILTVAVKKFFESTGYTSGRFDESGSIWVIAGPLDDRPKRIFNVGPLGPSDGRGTLC